MTTQDRKANWIPNSKLAVGDVTSLGTVQAVRISKSGKTMTITQRCPDGSSFDERVSSLNNCAIFIPASAPDDPRRITGTRHEA